MSACEDMSREQYLKKDTQPCKSEYPITEMAFNMNNESMSVSETIRYFKDLRRGSFLPTILENLSQAKGFYTRVNEQRKTVNFGTYERDFYSPTIHKRNANYRDHGPLYYEVRNPETVFDAFDRYSKKQNEEEDRIEEILSRLNNYKREIKDFFKSIDSTNENSLYLLQADFERFCRVFPEKANAFIAELNIHRANLARLVKEAASKKLVECMAPGGLNDQITKLKAEIKKKEQELATNTKKYETREETRAEFQHKFDEEVRKINKLLEDAYHFVLEVAK